jgi:phage/plasmid primase-like uncharacterized protein
MNAARLPNLHDMIAAAFDCIRAQGWDAPDSGKLTPGGDWVRFSTNGKKSDDSGGVKISADERRWFVVDHRSGFKADGSADVQQQRESSPEERAAYEKRVAERKARESKERAQALEDAKMLWRSAGPADPSHPYLARKMVAPTRTVRALPAADVAQIIGYRPKAGDEHLEGVILLCYVCDGTSAEDGFASLELIDEHGRKSALARLHRKGKVWIPARISSSLTRIWIAEGVATALSVQAALPDGEVCVAALSCGNILAAGRTLHALAPSVPITICADIQQYEWRFLPIQEAVDAAKELGADVIDPNLDRKGADFNDLHVERGLDAVRAILDFYRERQRGMKIDEEQPPLPESAPIIVDHPMPSVSSYESLFRDGKGNVICNEANMVRVLAEGLSGTFTYDTFTHDVLHDGIPYSESAHARVVEAVQGFYEDGRLPFAKASPDRIWWSACSAAMLREMNSAEAWLASLPEWDGMRRIDMFLSDIFGCEDTPYTHGASRYFWLSMVRRMVRSGAQADMALVLLGDQGIGKSKALRIIGEDRYTSTSFHTIGEKDWYSGLRGKTIVEIAEFAGHGRREIETIKAEMTKTHDEYRPPYGRKVQRFPRTNVFVGTVNPDGGGFLRDSTGERRWLPVTCVGAVNMEALSANRLQLYAEAYAGVRTGDDSFWRIPDAEQEQAAHRQIDPWEDEIMAKLVEGVSYGDEAPRLKELVAANWITSEVLAIPRERQNVGTSRRLITAMQAIGYARARWRGASGGLTRGFVQIGSDAHANARTERDGALYVPRYGQDE